MSDLDNRINKLESSIGRPGIVPPIYPSVEEIITKFGLDPVIIKAAAAENGSSIMQEIAEALGIPYQEFIRQLKLP